MTLSLVRATPGTDAGDRVTGSGLWSLTHELATDDDTGDDCVVVVATHLPTGLQLTHDTAGVDEWLMSGVALDELKALAVSTYNGFAIDEAKDAARAALVKLNLLLPAGGADTIEYYCECGGFLALAPGRQPIHVDACRNDIDPTPARRRPKGSVVTAVCGQHRICLEPVARMCEHAGCHTKAYPYAPPCELHERCCGTCCYGEDPGRD